MQPTPVFLPGESHGQRSLVGYSLRGRKESDTTEQVHFTSPHVHTATFKIHNLQGPTVWHRVFNGMWQPGWEESLGENGYINMYVGVPSLFTCSSRNIVHQLYSNTKLKVFKNRYRLTHTENKLMVTKRQEGGEG